MRHGKSSICSGANRGAFFGLPTDGLQAGGGECVDQAVVFGMVEKVVEDGDGEIRGSARPTSFDFCCSVFDDLFATDLMDWQVAKVSTPLFEMLIL